MSTEKYQIGSARNLLELARKLLRDRRDAEGVILHHEVQDVLTDLALHEIKAEPAPWETASLLARARSMHHQVREYADLHALHYATCVTPMPGTWDAEPTETMDRASIDAIMATMRPGDTMPPTALRLEENVIPEERESIPPSAPTGNLPIPEEDDDSLF